MNKTYENMYLWCLCSKLPMEAPLNFNVGGLLDDRNR